ncbi:MAG TPA: hypothetical protein VHP30_11635, partial [Ignavibacteriales bacterium]|nr:hypothetical protein [Ignavibacteriales bacterium]
PQDARRLELVLVMDKIVYKQHEPIYCYAYIKNISDSLIMINRRFAGDIYLANPDADISFELTPSPEEKYYATHAVRKIYPGDFDTLSPQERFYAWGSYIIADGDKRTLKAGSYKIKAKYKNYYQPSYGGQSAGIHRIIWLGEAESAEIEFKVE